MESGSNINVGWDYNLQPQGSEKPLIEVAIFRTQRSTPAFSQVKLHPKPLEGQMILREHRFQTWESTTFSLRSLEQTFSPFPKDPTWPSNLWKRQTLEDFKSSFFPWILGKTVVFWAKNILGSEGMVLQEHIEEPSLVGVPQETHQICHEILSNPRFFVGGGRCFHRWPDLSYQR